MAKKLPVITVWLMKQGVDKSTPKEEVQRLKKKYYKELNRRYEQDRKHREKRLNVRLTPEEYEELLTAAKVHFSRSEDDGKKFRKLGVFIKNAAMAYVQKQYIPKDSEQVEDLLQALRKIGHNINQIAVRVHRRSNHYERIHQRKVGQELVEVRQAIGELEGKVEDLETVLEKFMRQAIY